MTKTISIVSRRNFNTCRMKKVTLGDIAKSLGVSKTLVSLILNNKAEAHGISQETVKRVQKKVKELNYIPNQAARGLRTGKSNLIGLIVSDISNPFYSRISRSIEDFAWKNDYHLMVCSSDEDPEKELELIRILKEKQQVDGLIISTSQNSPDVFRQLKKDEFPFVLIDRNFAKFDSNYVGVENKNSSYQAVDSLIQNGAKNVGMLTISPSHLSTLCDRIEGYKDALKHHGIKVDDRLICEIPFDHIREGVKKAVTDLLKISPPVDALFLANNHLTVACLEVIRDMGLRIPYDIMLFSFDDIELFKFSYPPVSAISQPIESIGKNAIEILINILEKKSSINEIQKVILPTQLEKRRSSAGHLEMNS